MELSSLLPDLLPHTLSIGSLNVLQSLLTGFVATIIFVIFLVRYRFAKTRNPYNKVIQGIDTVFEMIYEMLAGVAGNHVGPRALTFVTGLFCFVLWQNLFGLFGDMIVLVWPAAHHVFRPMTTDIISNAVLAVVAVIASVSYGFSLYGFGFIKKYFPLHGMGIVKNITHRYDYITKFLDIILGLLIGIIEFLGEFGRILSLSLRLFGNMFVGMILLTLILFATQQLLTYSVLGPLIIFAYEFAVSLLQAFIFALLTTVYFKLASDH